MGPTSKILLSYVRFERQLTCFVPVAIPAQALLLLSVILEENAYVIFDESLKPPKHMFILCILPVCLRLQSIS